MAFPVPKVEIAFDDGPYVASPTWTDITVYVRSLNTDRGRSDDWGNFYGSASVVLDNRTRLFDPFYTSGTYYGKLLPRRQIRITATYGGTSYPVFRGFVAGWPPTWTNAGMDSTVTISCMDAMGLLASDSLPADWSRKYILSTAPRHYWSLDEPIQPYLAGQTITDYGAVTQNMTTSPVAVGGDQLSVGLVNSSISGTGGDSATTSYGAIGTATSFTVSLWSIFDPDNGGAYGEIGNCGWLLYYASATNKFGVLINDASSGLDRRWITNVAFDGGTARMVSFSFNQSTKAFVMYIDGVAVAVTATTSATPYIPVGEKTSLAAGQIQQVIIWDSVQTSTVIQNVYKYSTVNFPETTAARFQRLIGETSFPASMTSPPSAPASTVLDLTDDAPMTTSELQRVADSEYAPLFVDRSGILTLYYQNQIRTQTRSIVSQATYGGGSGVNIGPEVTIAYDGDSMRNVANITMSQGGVYIKKNTTSVATYGSAEASVDTEVASLANAQAVANIVQGWGGQVYPKADPFHVVLSPDNSWASTLDRELNDRITLVITPPTGNTITTPMLLSRVSHSAVPGEWRTTLEGSARWAAVFIIGQSLIGGTDLIG